jgi:hypothetical protein
MDNWTKNTILKKIHNGEVKQSTVIWKKLSTNDLTEIENSPGIKKVEKLYNWLYDNPSVNCKQCYSSKVSFRNFTKGYATFCSPQCSGDWYRTNETNEQKKVKGNKISKTLNSKSVNEWKLTISKRKQEKFKKYGDENFNNRVKHCNTMLSRYNVKYPLQIQEINTKFKNTIATKDWSQSIKLRKQTLLKNTGFEHQLKNPVVKEKIKISNFKKFGVENPSQCPVVAKNKLKSSYLKKEYIFPSGRKELVQGYEHFEITRLLKIYHEDDIVINQLEMPEIWYFKDGKKHRYFPDIFIPKENKIIEVKSDYTLKLHLEANLLKKLRCLELGFNFEFRIYDANMNLLDEEEFFN